MLKESLLSRPDIATTASLVHRLADAFEREEIVYGHWKSNIALAKSVAGERDLDLLLDRKSLPKALAIFSHLGFKAAVARWGASPPSIRHFYGFDPNTEQLIHVHLFSRVLTGESFVKSHLFPVDAMLLENAYYSDQIRVTSRPAELVLFTLRMFVKYGSLPDLVSLWSKSESLKKEVRWLLNDDEPSEALSLLRKHCPMVDDQLFIRCIDTLNSDAPLHSRILLGRQMRRQVKVCARHNWLARLLAYGQMLSAEVQRRLGAKQKNKVLQAGGAIIAFVGAEATGKSTLVAETERWLGSTFAVRRVHAGKPLPTLLTWPISLLLPLIRSSLSSLRTSRLEGHVTSSSTHPSPNKNKGLASIIYAVRAVILAWERRQLLVRAARAAANGEIIICDRYPSDTVGAMDSPRLFEQPADQGVLSVIFNRLARLERLFYKQIPPPDIVLRLHVSVDIAQQRNRERLKPGKETDAYVASRHRQSREWHKVGAKQIYDIDTEQSLTETILNVKKVIWESL